MLQAIYAREPYTALQNTPDAAVLGHQAISSNFANLEAPRTGSSVCIHTDNVAFRQKVHKL